MPRHTIRNNGLRLGPSVVTVSRVPCLRRRSVRPHRRRGPSRYRLVAGRESDGSFKPLSDDDGGPRRGPHAATSRMVATPTTAAVETGSMHHGIGSLALVLLNTAQARPASTTRTDASRGVHPPSPAGQVLRTGHAVVTDSNPRRPQRPTGSYSQSSNAQLTGDGGTGKCRSRRTPTGATRCPLSASSNARWAGCRGIRQGPNAATAGSR
jgi:hypothetical protein